MDVPADGRLVQNVLPEGFEVLGQRPIMRVQAHFNTDFAWLAGRGYNWVEVLFPVMFRGTADTESGDFVAVMWESMADPILPGREELGLPKLYADIPDIEESVPATVQAAWDGFTFFNMDLPELRLGKWPYAEEKEAPSTYASLGGTGRPRLYYKYIPRTGDLHNADAAYATCTPADNYVVQHLESWHGPAEVQFNRASWEQLPTFVNVVNALAELPVTTVGEGFMSRVTLTFDDLVGQRVLS